MCVSRTLFILEEGCLECDLNIVVTHSVNLCANDYKYYPEASNA